MALEIITRETASKEILNYASKLRDFLQGDISLRSDPEFINYQFDNLKLAIDFLKSKSIEDDVYYKTLMEKPWLLNFYAEPITPLKFLSEEYLGETYYSLYSRVKKAFLETYDALCPYRHIIFYPHIGWGKTMLIGIACLYITKYISLMWRPYLFFGQSRSTIYTQVFGGFAQKKAFSLMLEPLERILMSTPHYVKVDNIKDISLQQVYADKGQHLFWDRNTGRGEAMAHFANSTEYRVASSVGDTLGQTVVTAAFTELAFFRDKGWTDEKIWGFYISLRNRISNRLKSNFFGRSFIDTSPNDANSYIEKWILETAIHLKTHKVIRGSVWEQQPSDYPDFYKFNEETGQQEINYNNSFLLYRGDSKNKPYIIYPFLFVEDITKFVVCPVYGKDINLLEIAKQDPERFLRDYAGIPTVSDDVIFPSSDVIENCFTENLRSIYTHIKADSKEVPEGLIWNEIKDKLFVKMGNFYNFWYKPNVQRVLSVDQSFAKDVTSIGVSHVEYVTLEDGTVTPLYVTDFVIVIIPDSGFINLDAIRYFIKDLIEKGKINLAGVSSDSVFGETLKQYLERNNIPYEYVSVDRTNDAYFYFIEAASKGFWKTGRNIHVKNNMKSLIKGKHKLSGKLKIDHTIGELVHRGVEDWKTSFIGINAKDTTDTIAANIMLLKKYNIFPTDEWNEEKIKSVKVLSLDEFVASAGFKMF